MIIYLPPHLRSSLKCCLRNGRSWHWCWSRFALYFISKLIFPQAHEEFILFWLCVISKPVWASTVPVRTPHANAVSLADIFFSLSSLLPLRFFVLFVICLLLFALPFSVTMSSFEFFTKTKGSIMPTHIHWQIYGINLGCGKFSPANRNDEKEKKQPASASILASSTHHIHLGPFTASTIMPVTLCLFHCMLGSYNINTNTTIRAHNV